MTIKKYAGDKITGLSSDTKPTNVPEGGTFYELDTGKVYRRYSSAWTEITNTTANAALINAGLAFDKANSTTYTSNVVISVTDNTNAALRITQTGTADAIRIEDETNPDATPFIVDATGRLIIGGTSTETSFNAGEGGRIQIQGGGGGANGLSFYANTDVAGTSAPIRQHRRRRTGTGAVLTGDTVSGQQFAGYSGTNYRQAAAIYAGIDTIGTIDDTSMPGRISFETTANGSITPTSRLIIASSGNVLIGRTDSTVGSGVKLDIAGSANASNLLVNGNMVFTHANDGSGSNLDADLLDGQQGSYYGIATDVTAAFATANAAFDKANSTTYTSNVVISVTDNTNAALRITQTGTGEAIRVEDDANPDSSPFVVTSNGWTGVGTTTPASKFHIKDGGFRATGGDTFVETNLDSTAGYGLTFHKSRGTYDSKTVVNNGDIIGGVWGGGYDGAAYQGRATVRFLVDGTVSTGSVPTAIAFRTGNTTTTEYMRIASSGNVLIGRTDSTVGSGIKLDVAGAANASNLLVNGNMVWHSANDGSGSNLDADLLDGQHAAYYGIATDVTAANRVANDAFLHANAGYTFANSAHAIANLAFTHANNAYAHANAAFLSSNGVNTYTNSTYVKLTASSQTITGDLDIVGTLTLSGNTVFIDATRLQIDDPLIYLAGNNYTSDIVDIGFIANYVNATGQNVHTGLYREHENKEYYLFQGYDREPANNHIGAFSNNMTLAVLNADIKTSNLILGGVNAIATIGAAFNKANAALANATGTFAGDLTITNTLSTNGNVTIGQSSGGNRQLTLNSVGTKSLSLGSTGNGGFIDGGVGNQVFDLGKNTGSVFNIIRFTNNGLSGGYFGWYMGTTLKMVMDNVGNVGIAMSNPTSTLHVNGTANIVSTLLLGTINVGPTLSSAFDVANSGFLHANASYAFANSIAITANLAFAHANIAFANGNTVIQTAQSAFNQANLSFIHANNAFASANAGQASGNAAQSTANAAFNRANTANITADRAWNHANAAFATVNSAFGVANTALPNTSGVSFNGTLNFPTGNVGIGVTTPDAKLAVVGSGQGLNFNTAGDLGGSIVIGDSGTASQNGGSIVFSAFSEAWKFAAIKSHVVNGGSNTQGDIAILTRRGALDSTLTETARFTYSGNVTIGRGAVDSTVGLNTKLDVAGAVNASAFLINGVAVETGGSQSNTFTSNVVIEVADNTNAALRITQTGTADAIRIEDENNPDANAFVIDSAGRVIVGNTVSRVSYDNQQGMLQITNGYGVFPTHIALFANDSVSSRRTSLRFHKSRPSGPNLTSSSIIGSIEFVGHGSSLYKSGAAIYAQTGSGLIDDTSMPCALVFQTAANGESFPSTRMTIDPTGNVLIGTSTARSNFLNASLASAVLQVEGTAATNSSVSIVRDGASSNPARLYLAKSRGTTVGSNGLVTNGDIVGSISFEGNDGAEFVEGAKIDSVVDGTAATDSMPSRLEFHTSDTVGINERMRITSTGNVGIGTSNTSDVRLAVDGNVRISSAGIARLIIDADTDNTTESDHAQLYIRQDGGGTVTRLGYFTSSNDFEIMHENLQELHLGTNNTKRLRIDAYGNVVIGASATTYKLEVAGSFAAQTKSFVINHPTKPDMKLRYGSLEGPENGVYVRGRVHGPYIYLPEHWLGLVDENSITVSLTPIAKTEMPSVLSYNNEKIVLHSDSPIDCFYHVFGERKDVEKLIVEF